MKSHRAAGVVLLALGLAACGPDAGTSKAIKRTPIQLTAGNAVTGRMTAPAGTQAGTQAAAFGLLLAGDQPLAQVPVFTVTTDGTEDTRPWGRTDANGSYAVGQMQVDKLVRVRARIKTAGGSEANWETLAKTGQAQAADVDLASTMLAATLVAHAKGKAIPYDPATYLKALQALRSAMATDPGPDPADATALIARTEEYAKGIKDLKTIVGGAFTGVTPTPGPATSSNPATTGSPSPGSNSSPGTSPSPAASSTPSPSQSPTP